MCSSCGRKIYYSERVVWRQTTCFACAQARGLVRICDGARLAFIRTRASSREPWWQWTVWLEIALVYDAGRRK